MNFKLKEGVDTTTFTFSKKVIEEVINLNANSRNYTVNDISFYTMIAFLDNLTDNNFMLEVLADEKDLATKMTDYVEPLFTEHVKNNEVNLSVFNNIINDLIPYYEREVQSRLTLAGLLYDILDELGGLTKDDINKMIVNVEEMLSKGYKAAKTDNKEEKKLIIEEVKKDIDDAKMKAFIEKFQREQNTSTTK